MMSSAFDALHLIIFLFLKSTSPLFEGKYPKHDKLKRRVNIKIHFDDGKVRTMDLPIWYQVVMETV